MYDYSGDQQDYAVSQVSYAQTEKQHVKRSEKRREVEFVVPWQQIQASDRFESTCEPVVFQFDWGIVLGSCLFRQIIDVLCVEEGFYFLAVFSRGEPFKDGNVALGCILP